MASSKRALNDPVGVARARQRLTAPAGQRRMERIQKTLCDPVRLRIVQALKTGSLCVNDLAAAIDRAPAATSQHLRILRGEGVVEGTRRGTTILYRLHPGPAARHVTAVLQALEAGTTAPA